jgi:hypothetical protein
VCHLYGQNALVSFAPRRLVLQLRLAVLLLIGLFVSSEELLGHRNAIAANGSSRRCHPTAGHRAPFCSRLN